MTPATLDRARAPSSAIGVALALLLVATILSDGGPAHAAGTLYRWSEPDGSLTYSPSAPTDGTPYDAVDPMTMQPLDAAGDAPARQESDRSRSSISANDPRIDTPRPDVRLPDAMSGSGDGSGGEIVSPYLGAAIRASSEPTPSGGGDTVQPITTGVSLASREKERRCGELEKRVVSLERRLASPLTPEAMDDTVMQMARYQRSVESHCR